MSKWNGLRIVALSILLSAPLLSCRTLDAATSETTPYGTQLRERIDQWDRWCKGEKLGPYNDDPRRKQITTCDFLFLKDKRWDPDADEFSRYAHSIKLPPPHDKPQAVYRAGMSSREYFEELCAKEAGEWIFRTVAGVAGVLQARPHPGPTPGLNQLVPQSREVLAFGSDSEMSWLGMLEPSPFRYSYFEYPTVNAEGRSGVLRYYRSIESLNASEPGRQAHWKTYANRFNAPYVISSEITSRYAYVGRGHRRNDFLEHGITATELLIIDRSNQDVLALLRNFYLVRPAPQAWGLSVEGIHRTCPNAPNPGSVHSFVPKVLQPTT